MYEDRYGVYHFICTLESGFRAVPGAAQPYSFQTTSDIIAAAQPDCDSAYIATNAQATLCFHEL